MEDNKKDVLPLEGEPLTAPQISEPVVNALAAALNKIETYVPTQYINDGPPDIDAEHLNHAEQAIMRVTNLANGAADAIAALQSQVTQLNNNLGYYITSTDDFSHTLIGGAAQNITLNSKITLEQYARILFLNYPGSNDGALLAIAPGNKIITAFRNNGVWEEKSSHFIVTRSDLVAGTAKFPKTSVGTQEIIIDFPYEMRTVPVVLVSWKDTARIFDHMDGLVVTEIGKTKFKVASKRKIESYDWGFSYLAICR